MTDELDHILWCEKRAAEYIALSRWQEAVDGLMSDLSKHPKTSHLPQVFILDAMRARTSPDMVQRFVSDVIGCAKANRER